MRKRLSVLRRSALALLLGAACAASAPAASQAQTYPSNTVKIVVPFPAGGPTDIVARLLAEALGTKLNGRFIVENRPGASSTIGSAAVARAPKDGLTLLLTTSSLIVNPFLFKQVPYAIEDFTPIAHVAVVPYLFVAKKDLPAKTIPEFIALAKKDPGKYSYATNGPGTTTHLIGALITQNLGIDLLTVPYSGAAPAMTDTIAGRVDTNIEALAVAVPNIEAGLYHALAAPTAERLPQLPNVPTFKELGYDKVVAEAWFGVFGPADMPAEIVSTLEKAIKEVLEIPEIKSKMFAMGNPARYLSSEETKRLIATETPKWGEIVRSAGLEKR